jgi:hypothetical protein
MNKVIEANFLPPETNGSFSRSSWTGGWGTKERRRILIIDNDCDSTHLVKVLLERTGHYLVLEEKDAARASSKRPEFPARSNLARYCDARDGRRRSSSANRG